MKTQNRNVEHEITEAGIKEILSGRAEVVKINKNDVDFSVFTDIRIGEREGIGVYYPVYRDGSCASAQYFSLRVYDDKVIMERADPHAVREYDKERLGHLLRR